jgi:hypothetical protein
MYGKLILTGSGEIVGTGWQTFKMSDNFLNII